MNIQEVIIKSLETMSKKKVSLDDTLSSLKLDSFDLAELVIEAEEKFNVEIPDEEFNDIKTVKNVVELFEKYIKN
ncbi:phosphopantetheine-binding protein [Mycoplasmopsis ciconiae]|uniref:Phosphopantetheine-binding protein n=1 Tax=Mycoplasmopsis ciconiae TaxID=561067 RepID=A0ABU7MLM8_9BACT|nr:phosphopantetheine-binding protein [Mycoplasmopsis ciconiae]